MANIIDTELVGAQETTDTTAVSYSDGDETTITCTPVASETNASIDDTEENNGVTSFDPVTDDVSEPVDFDDLIYQMLCEQYGYDPIRDGDPSPEYYNRELYNDGSTSDEEYCDPSESADITVGCNHSDYDGTEIDDSEALVEDDGIDDLETETESVTNEDEKPIPDDIDDRDDGLPRILSLTEFLKTCPPRAPELIKGIVRVGHKMLITGCSKAGKSLLLIYLAIAIAEGLFWLNFRCRKGKVLYVNFEISPDGVKDRFEKMYDALGIDRKSDNLYVWNLRGGEYDLEKLIQIVYTELHDQSFDAIILDPIYKIVEGEENSATDMRRFCLQIDKLSTLMGCTVIMAHHHSKGAQGAKKAIDRSSGSGVFGRDADAILDIIELNISEAIKNKLGCTKAFRLSATLREYPDIEPTDLTFSYPLHRVDHTGTLSNFFPDGSTTGNLKQFHNNSDVDENKVLMDTAFSEVAKDKGFATVPELAAKIKVSEQTIRNWLEKYDDYDAEKLSGKFLVRKTAAGE